jgi:hypothetical protein
MFELALAAERKLCGANVELVEPDILLKTSTRNYLVACKRPEHEHGIRAAMRDAASQLRLALSSSPADYFGIIAVSLRQILNRGNTFFAGNYEQLSEILNGLMTKHRSSWRTMDFHTRNITVLFYAHTPADWGNGLFRLSAARMGPIHHEEAAHRDLKNDMTKLYSAAV